MRQRDELGELKRWLAAAASTNTLIDILDEWQMLRDLPPGVPVPAGRMLVVVGGLRDFTYLRVNVQAVRERHTNPALYAHATNAVRAASIVLCRRAAYPAQSPAPLLHLAYVASPNGRLQVISYTPTPIVPDVAPVAPRPPSVRRLPGWLAPLRPVVAAILGVPADAVPREAAHRPAQPAQVSSQVAHAGASSGAHWRGPLTGPLAG